jgi:serine protease AprX
MKIFSDTCYLRIIVPFILTMVLFSSVFYIPDRAIKQVNYQSYIVQGHEIEQVAKLVNRYGGEVTSRLPIISGVGALLSTEHAAQLKNETVVLSVTLNHPVTKAGDDLPIPATDYPDAVGANVVWGAGVEGHGIAVAVVDTGIGNLQGLLRDTNAQKGRLVAWIDFVENLPNPKDRNGHGSHVAAIIANTNIGPDGQWNGVAPGINLVGVRVLNEEGWGTYERVIQGIQWVIDKKDVYNIKVMNLSLVSKAHSPYWADPLNQAVMAAWASGITVVAAAGNDGPHPMTIGVPGNNPYVITVGAFTDNYTLNDWRDDYLAPFSAAGPTLDGFVKPDLIAPGAHMVSLMNPETYTAINHPDNQVGELYFSIAGTSQAAGVVSGVAALMLQKHPTLIPDEVKFRLMVTSSPWIDMEEDRAIYSMWQQGAGRVNAPWAVFAEVDGSANKGMDINADLGGLTHYEGFSYYDSEEGLFKLRNSDTSDYGSWAGDYGSWAGDYGSWAGDYGSWAGDYGSWAGDYGSWAGDYGSWAGDYGSWAGSELWAGDYGSWAGAYDLWAGGYGSWAGDYGSWAGDYGSWAGDLDWYNSTLAEIEECFMEGKSPDAASTVVSVNNWIDEE